MFYEKIDNLLIANCQLLVWRIERLTSIRQSSLARFVKIVNQIFVAHLLFFVLSITINGTYEAMTILFIFVLPFLVFHFNEIEGFSKNTLKQLEETKTLTRPPSVTQRKTIRKAVFSIGSLLFLLLFVNVFLIREEDLNRTTLYVSTVLLLSPITAFFSEFVLCTVPIPSTKKES